MADVTVCTGWHPPAWEQYARIFVESFVRHSSARLVAYTEEPVVLPERCELRALWEIPGTKDFVGRCAALPERGGRAPVPGWRPKDGRRGYAWRWDSVRFFKQCVIPAAVAPELPDGDALVWFDADVVFFADMAADFVDRQLGQSDVCYLGRNKGSEIGFWAVRLNRRSRAFLADLASLYLDDRVFTLSEWHSAFAFDHARKGSGMSQHNLTPGRRDHVWMHSPLAAFSDHLKGDRKNIGHSPEHPLRWWERRA